MDAEATITVRDALALPALRRGLPEVVAAGENLDRPVRWVHAGEVPDIASLLKGGELLLTTGLGIGARPAEQRAFVRNLAERGIAALVVELGGRFSGRLPGPLLDTARDRGLPLVQLHRQVPFVTVTEEIHTEIVNGHYAMLRSAEEVHRRCTELLLRGGGAPDVLRLLAGFAGNPVFLETPDGRLLYAASPAAPESPAAAPHTAAVSAGPGPAADAVQIWDRLRRRRAEPGPPSGPGAPGAAFRGGAAADARETDVRRSEAPAAHGVKSDGGKADDGKAGSARSDGRKAGGAGPDGRKADGAGPDGRGSGLTGTAGAASGHSEPAGTGAGIRGGCVVDIPGGGAGPGSVRARLVVLPVDRPLAPVHRIAAERTAGLLAVVLMQARQEEELAARGRGDFLTDLAEGRTAAADAPAQARVLGFRPADGGLLLPVVMRLPAELMPAGDWAVLVRAAQEELTTVGLPVLLGVRPVEGRVPLLLGLRSEGERAAAADRVAAALRAAVERAGLPRSGAAPPVVVVGVPGGWSGAGAGLRHAAEAAAAAQGLPDRPWHDARRLDIDLLLWRLREHPDLAAFVDRAIGPLLAHDRGSRPALLPTLEAYLAHAGRKAETARELHLNRQTLYDRLARIAQLLAADLDDPQTVLGLNLALQARRLTR
ncbi:PucR family transcriptional regulator [Streptomyces sp. NPDC048845]|uniref:PucR family transcriptional regulator n=1 Tax=Streptomyces sp. NPDC048845 TaxID=3155390 RepID=UPI0034492204